MATRTKPIIDVITKEFAIPITLEQARALGITETDMEAYQKRGELKAHGVWNMPISYKAIVEHKDFDTGRVQVWSARTMYNVRQGGYELEGYISLGGKRYTCFTSSIMFEIEGKLIDCACIFVRLNYKKEK